MPQLDFTMWLMNLLTCWLMFFLVFTSTNNINNTPSLEKNLSNNTKTLKKKWTW